MKQMCKSSSISLNFSIMFLRLKKWSLVPLPFLKPAWVLLTSVSNMFSSLFIMIFSIILWKTLRDMGVHNNIVKLIVNMYAGQQAAVRLECGMSDWFSLSKGVRQGCILSPHLFSLYTEGIMREVEQDSRKDLYNEPNIQGLKLRDLRYADDTALLSTTTEGLHQVIHSVKEHSENKGLFLNIKKTKIVDSDKMQENIRHNSWWRDSWMLRKFWMPLIKNWRNLWKMFKRNQKEDSHGRRTA